ncbi:LysM peptidoglycan-binding domain-containing protein [Paenibacillus sp. ACRRX]|uniref:LysM peptidoglycan-binding domain-containing protein n=1 Tax=unclassified Paenibacillus TaxID=185978 RepID=UPI001EF43DB7|nr:MULTISPECIES: LysM peptidoglycan-binding domain-containing protein [unclassified Paenibacillus]MCG7409996.1 LysM peptidoglycan-binding domain-containing protein [Paenibacillus sp. ACRRX]MDK8182939.1 LysM peptidoglycan-binding domain-containing protein [Paenibacillus sp. UMB4589-SE434]
MIEYVVRPGDSIYTIASRYGVSPAYLAQVNGLTLNDIVYPGQVVRVPTGSAIPIPVSPVPPFIPGGGQPIPPLFPDTFALERRVSVLERQVHQLQREVAQLKSQHV